MHNETEIPSRSDDLGALGTQVAAELPPELLAEAAPDERPPQSLQPWWLAALLAVVAGCIVQSQFLTLPTEAGAGPWQGFLAQAPGVLPGPLPPYWHGIILLVAQWGGLSTLKAAAVVALASTVALLALVAMLGARLAITLRPSNSRHWLRYNIVAAFCGFLAAFMLLNSEPLTTAFYSVAPSTLSAAFALLAYLLFVGANTRPGVSFALLLAAGLMGMACVDQPYFLVFAAMLFIRMLVFGPVGPRRLERWAGVVVVFLVALLWPALHLMQGGMAPQAVLEHILRGPYPDGSFRLSADLLYGSIWSNPFYAPASYLNWILVLFLPVPMVLLRKSPVRAEFAFMALAALLLWPMMGILANPPSGLIVPMDVASPCLLAVAMLLAIAVAAFFAPFQWRVSHVFGKMLSTAAIVAVGILVLPRTQEVTPSDWELHSAIDDSVALAPEGAIVVVGGLKFAGMLWGMQAIESLRNDLHIVPGPWLDTPEGRKAAQKILGDSLKLEPNFPTPVAMERWEHELPLQLASLEGTSEAEFRKGLHAFALWDLVSGVGAGKSICFLGESPSWLLARAQIADDLLVYPPSVEVTATHKKHVESSGGDDPWRRYTRSDLARRSMQEQDAVRRADIMDSVLPSEERKDDKPTDPLGIVGVKALEAAQQANGVLSAELRAQTDELWRADLLHVLRAVYETLAAAPKPDAEVHYQRAAVYAQLGLWKECGAALADWMKAFPVGNGTAFTRLSGDGRFALYLRHAEPTQQLPPEDSLPSGDATKP